MLAIGGAPLLVLATMGRTVLSATTVCVAPLLELAASVGGRAVWAATAVCIARGLASLIVLATILFTAGLGLFESLVALRGKDLCHVNDSWAMLDCCGCGIGGGVGGHA